MGVVVGESNEAGFLVELLFVHETHCPLPGALKATADALAAGNGNGKVAKSLFFIKDDFPLAVLGERLSPEPFEGRVTGHNSQPDAPAHRGAPQILLVGAARRRREQPL